jgi:hypothetical protein
MIDVKFNRKSLSSSQSRNRFFPGQFSEKVLPFTTKWNEWREIKRSPFSQVHGRKVLSAMSISARWS